MLSTKLKKHTRRCPGSNTQTEKFSLLFNNILFLLRRRSGDRWIRKHFNEKEIPADRPAWKIWTSKDYFRKLFYNVLFQHSIIKMYFQHRKLSRRILCIHFRKIAVSHGNK